MEKYGGMTVNERLYEAGLMDAWGCAAKAKNRKDMVAILSRVELEDQAEWIADTVLANPAKYGF